MKGVSLGSEDSGARWGRGGRKGAHIRKLGPGRDCQGAWVGRAGREEAEGAEPRLGGSGGARSGWLRDGRDGSDGRPVCKSTLRSAAAEEHGLKWTMWNLEGGGRGWVGLEGRGTRGGRVGRRVRRRPQKPAQG